MKKHALTALIAALFCLLTPLAMAEPADDLAAAQARIAELEAELAEKDARIAALEAQLLAAGGYDGSAPAAEFNGGVVTVAEARAEYEYRAYYYSSFDMDADEYSDLIKQEVLQSLVEDAILRQKAEEFGLYELTQADMEAVEQKARETYEDTVAYYMVYRVREGKTDEEVRQETVDYLAGEDYTLESVTQTLMNQTWRDRLYAYVTRDLTLTDAALEDYYRSELTSAELTYGADPLEYEYARMDGTPVLWNPEGYRRVKAILIGFDDAQQEALSDLLIDLENAADDGERARLLAAVDELYAALQPRVDEALSRAQSGEDFMALVDAYSADDMTTTEPTRSSGYYVSAASEVYMDEFRDAAMALNAPGDISQPVRSDLGVYILRYEADVPAGPVPFEEVRDQLTDSALEGMRDQLYNETVERWLEEADIVYHPDRF